MKNYLVWRIIGLLLTLAQAVVSVMCLVSVARLHILDSWVVVLAAVILAVLLVLCVTMFFVKKKPLLALRVLCMVVSAACIAGGIFALRYTNAFNAFLDKVSSNISISSETRPDYSVDITKDPYIVYISGTDSRTDIDDPTARSDVNILAVMNPEKKKILLVNIPRDTYVQLHGTTGLKDKLTHAGLNNNTELSRQTLEDFLGFNIYHTIRVSFDTVVEVVDELGGIEIFSDTAMTLNARDGGGKCVFVYGPQQIDGKCALAFSRERKKYYRGDRHRGENQQEVLTGIINKFLSSNDQLLRLPEILEIAGNTFETSFTRDDITTFLKFLLANRTGWKIESIGLDGEGDLYPTYTYGEDMPLWAMIPDEESYKEIVRKMNEYLDNDV